MMDEVQIVTYSPENHSAVRRLFSNGMLEHRKAAIFCGLNSAKLQILIVLAFMLGCFLYSFLFGVLLVFVVVGMQVYMVCWCYQEYVRYVKLYLVGKAESCSKNCIWYVISYL